MAAVDTCPQSEELSLLLLGQISEERAAEIEQHLDFCQRCLSVIGQVQVESQILDVLRAERSNSTTAVEPDLQLLMTQLAGMAVQFEAKGSSLHTAVETTDVPPHFAPAQGPGELGRLANFRVLELLGAGGMGMVYLAEDSELRRRVALKVLLPTMARDPKARERFLREARALASIKHERVVTIYQVGETDLSPTERVAYFAMELLEGESLQTWMQANRRPPLADVARIGKQIGEALAVLHARGLVHRDVKPSNLWLEKQADATQAGDHATRTERLKLLDFGLVLTPDVDSGEVRALGTPAYMAPEQLQGGRVDGRADVFALGCILYELCTGEHPFPDRRVAKVHNTPLPVTDLNPNVPVALSLLIDRLLQQNPATRIDSAQGVVRELAAVEGLLKGTGAAESGATAGVNPPHRRRTWLRIGMASLGLAAIVGIVVWQVFSERTLETAGEDDEWCRKIQNLSSKDQFKAVVDKLITLNPGYREEKVAGWVEPEAVLRFTERTDQLVDISPVRCLVDVKSVGLFGSKPGLGKLTNIAPLRGLRLFWLKVARNPDLIDITPVRGMPLNVLDISHTGVKHLNDVVDLPLESLFIASAPIEDLAPLRALSKLQEFDCTNCPIRSLEPLSAVTSLTEVRLSYQQARDEAVLKSLPKLRIINSLPTNEFWQSQTDKP